MSNVFRWDELEIIRKDAEILFNGEKRPSKKDVKQFCDYLEFVLCLVYAYGWKDAEEIVGIVPFTDGFDDRAVNLEIAGETFRDRITPDKSYEEVLRVIDTESHRDYNTAVYDAAKESGKSSLKKKWQTMKDDKVRDQHSYLDGMVVGIDDYFYTDTGESALYPGGFGTPDLDVNCRCWVTIEQ